MTTLIHKDRVKETTNSTGTGNLLLNGAVLGFYSCAASFTSGQAFGYLVENTSTGENEVGIGQVVTSGGNYYLQRNSVERSSNANAAVNFGPGTKNVCCVLLATELPQAASQVTNDSSVTGSTVKDALNTLQSEIGGFGTGNVSATNPTTQYTVPYWKNTSEGLSSTSPLVMHEADDGSVGKLENQVGSIDAFTIDADGATVAFNFDNADKHQVTLGGNRTLTYVANSLNKGQRIVVRLIQDATGGRTVTWWSGINWNNAQPPILDPTPNGIDVVELECVSVDSYGNATCDEVARSTTAPRKGLKAVTYASAVSLDLRVCPKQWMTLTGNTTLSLVAGSFYTGQMFMVGLAQDATGSRVATWFSGITSTPPAQSTTASRVDWYLFLCRDATTPKFDLLGASIGSTA